MVNVMATLTLRFLFDNLKREIIPRMNHKPYRGLIGILVFVGWLTACNMPIFQPPDPVPTVDPASQTTDEPLPTIQLQPTATPLPIQVVSEGERALRNGDWDSAALAFQQVLTDPGVSQDEMISAQLGLAHASLRRGDFISAQGSLDSFLMQYADHEKSAQAYFLRGEAKLGLSDWSGAITDFQSYLALRPGVIDSYVYERIADSYLALEQPDQAIAAYNLALEADRYTVGKLALRERVAWIHRTLGNTDDAVAQYQLILAEAENNTYRAYIEFLIGQAYFEAGRTDEAYQQFSHVFMTYPNSTEALDSLRALLDAEFDVDQFQRGLVNYNNGQYDIAVSAFYNYLANSGANYPPDAHLYIARSYRWLENPQAALTELQGMLNLFDPEDSPIWGEAWLEIADIYAATGDLASAYTTYEQFAADHPDLPQASEALYQAALLAENQGDIARAANYYQKLSIDFPGDPRPPEGLYSVALLAYRQGDYTTAETLFTTATGFPSRLHPAAGYFWLGKTRLAQRRNDEAAEAFNLAVNMEDVSGYYAIRAVDLLAGQQPFTAPIGVNFMFGPDEGREEAEQWLIATFGLAESPPLATTLRSDIAGDPRLGRGLELWSLGLLVDARQDFEAVRHAFEDDPLATYQLSIFFREIGLYRSSILAAQRLHYLADTDPLEGPAFIARLRYPTYFSDLILEDAEKYNLNPLYVFSLIWQESIYEGFAVSSASAQGLMQIWPPTGEDIAVRLAWPDYRPSDLQRPYVNVAFGTWLLRDELDRFDNDPYAALSAYNAGPGNTATWKEWSSGDPDLFVEVISLAEPQLYITRIYEHYAVYTKLYSVQ